MTRIALLVLAACNASPTVPTNDASIETDAPESDAAEVTSFAGSLTGTVTSDGVPVAGAEVRFGGRHEFAIAAGDGTFTLVVEDPPVLLDAVGLTASKTGYWNGGGRVFDPATPQQIELVAITQADDATYAFKSADDGNATPYCKHCHEEQVADWRGSAHARATSDRQLHDLYNGTASGITNATACVARGGQWRLGKSYGAPGVTYKCYVGAGVLPDLNACGAVSCDDPSASPTDVSVCADCHAPASAGHVAGATNLNAVDGIAFDEGVTCDFCHKIESVAVNQRPGVAGAITLRRPAPPPPDEIGGFSKPEIMFGPYGDTIAFFMGGVAQPQFRRSELCSACHQWSEPGFRAADKALVDPVKWPLGLPLQDTYAEWTTTTWATLGIECQHCHMPASDATTAANDKHDLPPSPSGNLGWVRPFGDVRRHLFRARLPAMPGWSPPPNEPGLDVLREPLALSVAATKTNNQLAVTVSVANTGAGHAFPSGTPSRALFLVVRAEVQGAPLRAIGGQTIPEWTGSLVAGEISPSGARLEGAELIFGSGSVPTDVVPGAIVRFVRATGAWADDPGVGWFGAPSRTPQEKGLPVFGSRGEAVVIEARTDRLVLDRAPIVPAGTRFVVGGAPALAGLAVDDELPEVALAGAPGWVFGKVMIDAGGTRGAPFWRAIDIAADNRIPAGATATTNHVFEATVVGTIKVTATLLYRRHAFSQAHLRGWQAVDVVRGVTTIVVP